MIGLSYERCKVTYGNLAAAGTTEVKSAVGDMNGYDEVEYEITFGDNVSGSVVTITPKENTANSTTSPSPTQVNLTLGSSGASLGTAAVITTNSLVVTAGTSDTDNKIVLISLKRHAMTKRYQFLSVTPATQNAVIASIVIRQYGRDLAATQSSDVIATAYAAA